VRILLVLGTRPEAIKLAPVARALEALAPRSCRVCATAQHRELLDRALADFALRPDHSLNLMRRDQTLHHVAAKTIERLAPILRAERPDFVVVQGDTTSAAAAALAAVYAGIPVAHVEAGLRTGDLRRPFPEEANRRVIDAVSALHFAPTEAARRNLLREGTPAARVFVTGNTVVDALKRILARPAPPEVGECLERLGARRGRKLVLVTAHRRESFGRPFTRVLAAVRALAASREDVGIAFVSHPNPNVLGAARRALSGRARIALLAPLGYAAMAHLLKASALVLTDSGGLQEEAASLGVPTLVLREETDRPEAVAAGVARLVGTDPARIARAAKALLDAPARGRRRRAGLYGDGRAGERIAWLLRRAVRARR
jgi:UDP-N-acetylglucosamine 2-epimerase (non-hydrolysing)